jgi:hypothetical protein
MYLSVYTTGNFLKSQNLDEAFAHPGEYWVVNVDDTNNLHLFGINRIPQKLKIENFSLERCERINNGYRFSFCDFRDNKLYRKDVLRAYIENSLSFLIKCFFEASKFPNWETYNEFLKIDDYKEEITNLKERILQLESENKQNNSMITNILYQKPEFIGINIEKINNEFVVCVAFKSEDKWMAKTLSGISGDLIDVKLFDKVISIGYDLDKKTASEIFTKATELGLEYSSK